MDILDTIRSLEQHDKEYVWHPFTQMKDCQWQLPEIITEGRGCFIKDIKGRWYIDGISSLWVNIHGHRKKEINDKIKEQLDTIAHSTLLGLANEPSIELARRLVALINEPLQDKNNALQRVFYSDNGSTAVEVALKMAFQYSLHMGQKEKKAFLYLNNAYHGDTVGAMSVGGVPVFHDTFKPLMFKTFNAPSPYCYRCELDLDKNTCQMECADKMEEILKQHCDEICAVIVEPLMQCAGGMVAAPSGYLARVRQLCSHYNVLLIADEVATGFGRTGKMFACWHEDVWPDILCLSKGITGGYLPLAVTVATNQIYNAFLGEYEELKTFFHGHSYTGNQLGCAAALGCLDVFEKERTLEALPAKIKVLTDWLEKVTSLKGIGDTRNAGLMAGVELVMDKESKEPYPFEKKMPWQVTLNVRKRGVFIRPIGNVLVIMPPLAIELEHLTTMLEHIEASILEVLG